MDNTFHCYSAFSIGKPKLKTASCLIPLYGVFMAIVPDEKEVVFALAQSLMNDLNVQMNKGMKAATDVRPYAKRYAILRERILTFGVPNSDILVPDLPQGIYNSNFALFAPDIQRNVGFFDELMMATGQMVAFLSAIQKTSSKVLTELEEFLFKNLRKNVLATPSAEKEIQDIVSIMLNTKGYSYEREKIRISYSSKTFVPDFTFEDLNAALEIKLC